MQHEKRGLIAYDGKEEPDQIAIRLHLKCQALIVLEW